MVDQDSADSQFSALAQISSEVTKDAAHWRAPGRKLPGRA
jgi:hypothetical protein